MNAGKLRERLDDGERLVWSGSPVSGGDDTARPPEPAVKSIYGIILKALMIPVIIATVGFFILFRKYAVISLPFWISPFILLFLYRRPEEWMYGITDKRVMIGTEKSGIVSYSFDKIKNASLYIGENGIGCITFEADGVKCGLYGLENAKQIKALLPSDKFLE